MNFIQMLSAKNTEAGFGVRRSLGFSMVLVAAVASASAGCLASHEDSAAVKEDAGAGGDAGGSGGDDGSTGGSTSASGGEGGAGGTEEVLGPAEFANDCSVEGGYRQWHRVAIVCNGPWASENDDATFSDYRMEVTFEQNGRSHRVFGHFAADGQAGSTGVTSGSRWRAYFMPPSAGVYSYKISFRQGPNIAVSDVVNEGEAVPSLDGKKGRFRVGPTNKKGRDMRAHGLLQLLPGERYLRHAGSKRVFVEGGVDSPENLFGYADFDNTVKNTGPTCKGILHQFAPHLNDWQPGDPTWGDDGRGKSLIGLVNYLASRRMNAIYIVPMSEQGDGCDGYPWTEYGGNHRAFDVSKLDQWEVAFSHMTAKGFLVHFVTQETENDQLLNGGNLGLERKLYYREMISRFAHHPALQWNLGEENTNTVSQQKAYADFIKAFDPYKHPVVMHTFPGQHHLYDNLLGHSTFDGPTLQYGNIDSDPVGGLYGKTRQLLQSAQDAGKSWYVTATEASGGDAPQPHDPVSAHQRVYWMYANTMAGGAGIEWYLKNAGQGHAYDLAVEDLREFDAFWKQTGFLNKLFNQIIPGDDVDLNALAPNNELSVSDDDWILAQPGEAYLVFLRKGGNATLQLSGSGSYRVSWYNPRTGALLDADSVSGGGTRDLGQAPNAPHLDWVVWVRR